MSAEVKFQNSPVCIFLRFPTLQLSSQRDLRTNAAKDVKKVKKNKVTKGLSKIEGLKERDLTKTDKTFILITLFMKLHVLHLYS